MKAMPFFAALCFIFSACFIAVGCNEKSARRQIESARTFCMDMSGVPDPASYLENKKYVDACMKFSDKRKQDPLIKKVIEKYPQDIAVSPTEGECRTEANEKHPIRKYGDFGTCMRAFGYGSY